MHIREKLEETVVRGEGGRARKGRGERRWGLGKDDYVHGKREGRQEVRK
jgi:hypothetical protein